MTLAAKPYRARHGETAPGASASGSSILFLLCHYFAAEECIRTAKAVLPTITSVSRRYELEDEISNWSSRCMKYLRDLHAMDECPEDYRELFAIRSCPLIIAESWRYYGGRHCA